MHTVGDGTQTSDFLCPAKGSDRRIAQAFRLDTREKTLFIGLRLAPVEIWMLAHPAVAESTLQPIDPLRDCLALHCHSADADFSAALL